VTVQATAQDIENLRRFIATSEDDEGYDISKDAIKRLKALGFVSGGRFGWYSLTEEGRQAAYSEQGAAQRGEGDSNA
jgi:hypothetical protein